jgi:hypothetical protein
MRSPTASAPCGTGGRGVRYARRPRRTLCSHDRQRASRKPSVHAVVLCESCSLLYCPGATRLRRIVLPQAFGLPAIVAGLTFCATSTASAAASITTTTMQGPTHRRLRQALRLDNDAQSSYPTLYVPAFYSVLTFCATSTASAAA